MAAAKPGLFVAGLIPHVATGSVVRRDGTPIETFSRGIGRNRVAFLVKEPLPLGEPVEFAASIDGGELAGSGRVERIHVSEPIDGVEELWVVIDIENLERGSARRLLRALFRDRYIEYAQANPQLRLPPAQTLTQARRGEEPEPWGGAAKPPGNRKRPKVGRYAAPEVGERWRVRR